VEVRPEVGQVRRAIGSFQPIDARGVEVERAREPVDVLGVGTLEVDPQERRVAQPVEAPDPVVQLLDLVLPEEERLGPLSCSYQAMR
jgi:hypothetical protein